MYKIQALEERYKTGKYAISYFSKILCHVCDSEYSSFIVSTTEDYYLFSVCSEECFNMWILSEI